MGHDFRPHVWGPTPHDDVAATRCDLCERRWLFVVSLGGRTGSTTLLNMLNAHPAIELRGEDCNLLADALRPWRTASLQPYFQGPFMRKAISPNNLLCDLQRFVEDTIRASYETSAVTTDKHHGDRKIIGFKEIRWMDIAPDLASAYPGRDHALLLLDFATMLFPCGRFIFNVRSDMTALSESWAKLGWINDAIAQEKELQELKMQTTAWKKHVEWRGRGDSWRSFWMPLENFTVSHFNEMLAWMGEDRCRYVNILHDNYNHSYLPDPNGDMNVIPDPQSCSL